MFQRVNTLISNDRRPDSLLARALESKDLIGFESEDEAAIVSIQLIAAAADTVCPHPLMTTLSRLQMTIR